MNHLFPFRPLATLSLALLLAGCIQVGKTSLPAPTAGFAPQASYAVGTDRLWEASLGALEKNRIPVAASDRASGTLQTDYVQGPSRLIGLGLSGAQSTRYKFNLALRAQGDAATRLTVLARVESTINSGKGSSQWTDVSGHNPELVRSLEAWLHQQVETELPKP